MSAMLKVLVGIVHPKFVIDSCMYLAIIGFYHYVSSLFQLQTTLVRPRCVLSKIYISTLLVYPRRYSKLPTGFYKYLLKMKRTAIFILIYSILNNELVNWTCPQNISSSITILLLFTQLQIALMFILAAAIFYPIEHPIILYFIFFPVGNKLIMKY